MTMDFGHKVFEEKWGRPLCNIRDVGLKESDAWRVEPEWEKPQVQHRWRKDREREDKDRLKKEKDEEKEVGKEMKEKEKSV